MTYTHQDYFLPTLDVLNSDLVYPSFPCADTEEVLNTADDLMSETLYELVDQRGVDTQLAEQAAFCVAQYFIDGMAILEAKGAIKNLSHLLEDNTSAVTSRLYQMLYRVSGANLRGGN